MAETLFEYYQKKGQILPSITERGKLYESSGLGSASAYTGKAEQNIALLGKLQATPASIISPEKQAEAERIKAEIAKVQKEIQTKQAALSKALAAGIKPGEPIPAEYLTGVTPFKDQAPVPPSVDETTKEVLAGTKTSNDIYQAMLDQMKVWEERAKKAEEREATWFEKAKTYFEKKPTYAEMEEEARKSFLKRYGLPEGWEKEQMQKDRKSVV